jgi:hypothetical protein
VAAQQPDRFAVRAGRAAFANLPQRRLVGLVHAEQDAADSRLPVEMQNVGIAHDVVGPHGAEHRNIDARIDQGFEHFAPESCGGGGGLVGAL